MNNRRLKILSKSEINELYDIPHFTDHERQTYFSLSEKEYRLMAARGSLSSKVHFILQLGYFKAISLFFNFEFNTPEVQRDVDYILAEHFSNKKLKITLISKKTRQLNQTIIAKLLGYTDDKAVIKEKISKLLESKTRICNNPFYLFQELLSYSDEHKLMLLGYSTLQDLIGNAITQEEKRLGHLLEKYLSNQDWNFIKKMLTAHDAQYVLTALKKDPKSFNHKQIMGEVKKLQEHQALYDSAKKILPKLKLSNRNIDYYASLAAHYPINDLQKLSKMKKALYIICHIHHRYQKINDNLMVSYFHYVTKFNDEAGSRARDYIFNEKIEINEDSKQAAIVLRFFDDESIPDKESFGHILKRAYQYIEKGKYSAVSDYLEGILFDYQKTKWDEISKLKPQITKNLRPIFNSLNFTSTNSKEPILMAIQFLKNYFSASETQKNKMLKIMPIEFLPKLWQKYVMITPENNENGSNKIVDIKKYEFMLYQLIIQQIELGHFYLDDSISFKSFSDHLISDEKWRNKVTLLKKLGNEKLLTPIDKLLDQAEIELEQLTQIVNQRIENGDNKDIKIKKNGDDITFVLPYPKFLDKENHPIFKQLPQVGIAEIFQFVQKECNFMQSFTHIKPYDAKDISDPVALMACIIANATNLGIHKMAETSDLNYQRMQSQQRNFIRVETLREANDIITNAIAKLPILKYWNINNNDIHGSVDGQKFEIRLHSFIARYSSKYFGLNKGVVAYTLCANHIPVNAKIISANQHESHYMFDILFNNKSDIDISWLSGDGHSINQVNFALLDFIGKQFAPHFKRINHKIDTLHGFGLPKYYEDLIIKPKYKINKKLIRSEWDNIKRIIVSLLLGETSQHLIVSKLSSYKRKNKTKEALWEYDKILMSIYMLNFINDPVIPQNVRRALNRGEAYHQLRRAIANVHGRKFRGSNERGLELWNECARLMANCMIYYNAMLLNSLLAKLQKEGNDELIDQLKYISPVAWQHINLYGYYTFNRESINIDINLLADAINMMKDVA